MSEREIYQRLIEDTQNVLRQALLFTIHFASVLGLFLFAPWSNRNFNTNFLIITGFMIIISLVIHFVYLMSKEIKRRVSKGIVRHYEQRYEAVDHKFKNTEFYDDDDEEIVEQASPLRSKKKR